ncbi:MAG: L-seryl-tRNA(Sec) selenium transferase [Terriglobales bacterium]
MPAKAKSALFQKLPSTDELLQHPDLRSLAERDGHAALVDAIRAVLARLREEIANDRLDEKSLDLALAGLPGAVERQLRQSLSYSLRAVINATGVILHTNLGRAPLAAGAFDHIRQTAVAYSNLEFDLETGERGKRDIHVDRLFQKLFGEYPGTGAAGELRSPGQPTTPAGENRAVWGPRPGAAVPTWSTIAVNNNAAAVLLALNSLAEGGEVIVSRGELVEIGGSFRIPDVMSKSQATLREVGTTNRTRVADYERAITERTRLLLRVHRSNFAITGFTEQPSLSELATLARRRNLPLMEDLGSGALIDLRSFGISGEAGVLDSLRAGVDLVTYSGDKLLGGPQAGLITGRADLVARLRSNSLFRALRVDKLTYAALEATLLAYVKGDHDAVPILHMMRLSKDEIAGRAEALAARIDSPTAGEAHQRGLPPGSSLQIELCDGESVIGGGAAPTAVLPTRLIALTHRDLNADDLCRRLRQSDPPIIARVEEARVLLDLRTVFPYQDSVIADFLDSVA